MGSTFPSWLGAPSFINMVHIELKKCHKCVCLPPLGQLSSLKSLLVEDMDGIKEVGLEFYGNWSSPFLSLKTLHFSHMKSWEKWVHPPVDYKAFSILENLSISDCPSLQGNLPYQYKFPRFGSLFSNLTSLENRPELHNFPGGLPTNLVNLYIRETNIDVPIKEWGLHLLTSLVSLTLTNVGSCVDTIEYISYPDFPSSLYTLIIEGFQNLKTICCSTLPNLSTMSIYCCPKLESFGDDGLPPHIEYVYIEECDIIEQQLTSDPYGRIRRKNRKFSLPLPGSQVNQALPIQVHCLQMQ